MAVEECVAAPPRRSLREMLAPAALLLIGVAAVALYAAAAAPLRYPYGGDSSSFIEAARSLLLGQPMVISVPFGYASETQIFRLWPPGYPALIAAVASIGIDAADASLWLTRTFLALLPLAVYWAIHRSIGKRVAIAAALLACTAIGLLPKAHFVSTDAPFAFFVTMSLGCLLRGLDRRNDYPLDPLLVSAGLFSALAITIRNSGVALVLAEGATLAALWFAGEASFARTVRRGLSVAVGLGIGITPLLLWNVVVLGELRPYDMPPSTVGMAQNVTNLLNALAYDLFPVALLSGNIASVIAIGLFAGGSLVALITMARLRGRASPAGEPFSTVHARVAFLAFAVSYSLISAAMLVVARSRYEWGEQIGPRHVAQFDWLLVAAVLAAAFCLPSARRKAASVLIVLVVGVIALRIGFFADFVQRHAAARDSGRPLIGTAELEFSRSAAAAHLIGRIPNHCDIIGDAGRVIQVTYHRRARIVWERNIDMSMFANLRKPSVLIFMASPTLNILDLPPPGPGYHTIRDPVFVAFVADACQPVP